MPTPSRPSVRALILIEQSPDGRINVTGALQAGAKPDDPAAFVLADALAVLMEHLQVDTYEVVRHFTRKRRSPCT